MKVFKARAASAHVLHSAGGCVGRLQMLLTTALVIVEGELGYSITITIETSDNNRVMSMHHRAVSKVVYGVEA